MAAEIVQGLNSYFTFRLGAELFAVNVGNMTKILGLTDITRVPNSPHYFLGIINLFGEVLPVFDGRLKFGLPKAEATRNTCILMLVFETEGQAVSAGIVVDSAEKVIVFEPDHIQPVPTAGKGFNGAYIQGIAAQNNEFAIILNIEKIFSEEEISLIISEE
jgi:purine-binding chemotaxis protein CheW